MRFLMMDSHRCQQIASALGRCNTLGFSGARGRRKGDSCSISGGNNYTFIIVGFVITVFCVSHVVSVEEDSDEVEPTLIPFSSATLKPEQIGLSTDEEAAKKLLEKLEQDVQAECSNRALKEWQYATNITAENRKAAVSQNFNSLIKTGSN